jgi:hypothetical protein
MSLSRIINIVGEPENARGMAALSPAVPRRTKL